MTTLDHRIKEQWKAKAYVRYMDDLVIWQEDKPKLRELNQLVEQFVNTRLALELKPSMLNKSKSGLTFCGYQVFPHKIRLSQRSAKRYIRKINKLDHMYQTKTWEESICQRKAQSLIAFTRHADALAFRKKVWAQLPSSHYETMENDQ